MGTKKDRRTRGGRAVSFGEAQAEPGIIGRPQRRNFTSTFRATQLGGLGLAKPMRSIDKMSRTPARFTQADVARTVWRRGGLKDAIMGKEG
jgi:hypothetical protein